MAVGEDDGGGHGGGVLALPVHVPLVEGGSSMDGPRVTQGNMPGGFLAAVAWVVSVFVFASCRAAAAQVGHAIYVSCCTRPVMDYAWLTPLVAKLRKPGLRFQSVPLRGWLPDWDAVSLGSCGIASLPADADNGCLMYQSSA